MIIGKTGFPRAVTPRDHEEDDLVQTPEEFAREFFGSADKPQDDKGLPSRDWLKSQFKTKSAAIRYLISKEFAVKDIAKHLDVKYQHVRNVSTNKLKRGPNEPWTPKDERDTTQTGTPWLPEPKGEEPND